MKKISLFLVVTTLIVFACTSKKENIGSKYINPENLTTQSFTINTTKDTVIKTNAGIKIKFDANSIEAATQSVTIKIKEALDINDILKAGLTTQTKDGILSSDGMFKIETEEKSAIKKPLQIEVPTNTFDNEMQVYKGVEEDGQIVWQDPKSIEKQNKPDGKTLFVKNCTSCHSIDKNTTGPALAWVEERWQDKDNLIAYIKNPGAFLKEPIRVGSKTLDTIFDLKSYERARKMVKDWEYANFIFCEWNKQAMTAFEGQLNDEQINAILNYIAVESKSIPKEKYPNNFDSCFYYEKRYTELVIKKHNLIADNGKMVEVKDMNPTADTIGDLPKVSPKEYNAEYYKFTINAYGWYNVDKLLENKESVQSKLIVNIKKTETQKFQVYLAVPSLKIFAVGGLLDDNINYGFYSTNGIIYLPQNIDAYIIAVGEEDNKTYFGLEHFTTSQNQTINLKVEETSKEKITKKIARLKFDDFKFGVDTTKNYSQLLNLDEEMKQLEIRAKKKCECMNSLHEELYLPTK